MAIDLKRLRQLASRATGGRWEWEHRGPDNKTISLMAHQHSGVTALERYHPLNLLNTDSEEWDWNGAANRDYMEAISPVVLLELLDMIEERDNK